ncbi:MAG: hypothetical protein JW852_05840 [Spirochaetales bacterium]|nr:hypothetical protein [Spirochaetales bacterium]
MSKIPVHAKKGTNFYAPRFSSGKFRFATIVGPLYNRLVQGIAGIEVLNMELLHRAYLDFERKRVRLIILFRHGAKADGPVVLQTVVRELKKWCRATGKPLATRPHTHFLYGKDVLNWAGSLARWIFPGIGGVPVVNGRMEKQAHSVIRKLLKDGQFPVAFAPEGQVTYHTYRTFPFSAGTTKLAAWTHQDLRNDGREESVIVLPMAIGYRYAKDAGKLLKEIIKVLDLETGLRASAIDDSREALLETTESLLDSLEKAYACGYPQLVDFAGRANLQQRVDRMCDMILKCHEAILGYRAKGEILDRIFRVRYWDMDSVHREDIDPENLAPVERSLADHRAYIASAAMVHQQIVDLLEYVGPDYIKPGCTSTRLVEYGMNLLDLCNRISGGNVDSRFFPKRMRARVLFGEPVDASAYFEGPAGMSRIRLRKFNAELRSIFDGLVARLEERYG